MVGGVNDPMNLFCILKENISIIFQFAIFVFTFYMAKTTLGRDRKDREQPTIVQLVQFFLTPLMEWLESRKGKAESAELDLDRLLSEARIPRGRYEAESKYPLPRPPRLIHSEFHIWLKKLKFKDKWDKKVGEYGELHSKMTKNMDKLHKKLHRLVEEDPNIKKRYKEVIELKGYYTFDVFKEKLVDEFYSCYIHKHLSGAWHYAGEKVFNSIKTKVDHLLTERKGLKECRDNVIDELMSLLTDMRMQLKNKYYLTPSQLDSLVSFFNERIDTLIVS